MTASRTVTGTEFVCGFCGKQRGDAQNWLLALEGTKVKSVVMKYAVTLLGKWDEERANQPNALHFCSATCQSRYLAKNYGDDSWSGIAS